MYTQSFPLFEAPLAHEVGVHTNACTCRQCRSQPALPPGQTREMFLAELDEEANSEKIQEESELAENFGEEMDNEV